MTNDSAYDLPAMRTFMGAHSESTEQRRARILASPLALRIDHILFTEWDPIGVHWISDDLFDEYLNYVPKVARLVELGRSHKRISNYLWFLETDTIGVNGSRRRCDVIAVMVSQYGERYSKNSFSPSLDTSSGETAYQSVLDIVTQTRLDAYANNWEAVRRGYETAIDIGRQYLPERIELLGTCTNNLGHALHQIGDLEGSFSCFEQALSLLDPKRISDKALYFSCLENLIENLRLRGERDALSQLFSGGDFPWRNGDCAEGRAETYFEQGGFVIHRIPVEGDQRIGPPGFIEVE